MAQQFKINFGGKLSEAAAKKKKEENFPAAIKTFDYENTVADYETDAAEEMAAVKAAFRQNAKKEMDSRDDYMDVDFYTTIIFSNKAQRQAFLQGLGLDLDDNTDTRFINGLILAKILGIELPLSSRQPPEKFKVSKDIMKLAHLPKPKMKGTKNSAEKMSKRER